MCVCVYVCVCVCMRRCKNASFVYELLMIDNPLIMHKRTNEIGPKRNTHVEFCVDKDKPSQTHAHINIQTCKHHQSLLLH